MERNMEKIIQEVKMNERFNITACELTALRDVAKDSLYKALYDAFKYGYALGGRAKAKELKTK